jgi:hypothetical protein
VTVDKNQAMCWQATERECRDLFACYTGVPIVEYRFEGQFGYGRYIREPPVFLLYRWEARIRKTRHPSFAQRENPGGLTCLPRKPLELFQIRFSLFH